MFMSSLIFLPQKMKFSAIFIAVGATPLVGAIVAYPRDWTAHQPDQISVGYKQVLVGTPSYFFTVAETEDGFYTTIKDQSDGYIKYAVIDPSSGELIPSQFVVGRDDPDDNRIPPRAVEDEAVIRTKCLQNAYCSWKLENNDITAEKPSGEYKNLVIPFKFSDHADRNINLLDSDPDIQRDTLHELFNDDHTSVKDFFESQSYSKLTMINDFAEEIIISKTESYCADNASGLSVVLHECLAEALAGKSTAGYDTITFVHSGYGAEHGNQDQYDAYFDDRIWSHSWKIDTPEYAGRYALLSAFFGMENGSVNHVGAAVHEIAQAMGAPTQYGEFPGYGLGYYDVMANPWGFDGTLYHCGSMSAYTKAVLGWVDVEEIDSEGMRAIAASSISNKVYKISRGYSGDEYLLLENRQATGYGTGMRQPGIAIYHVDSTANGKAGHPEDGVYPVNRYHVALVQADGRFDLERQEDEGDMGDLFHHDRFSGIGPNGPLDSNGDVIADHNGYPNTKSYSGGNLVDTGVTLTGIC